MGPFIPHKIKPRVEHDTLQVGQRLRMIHRYSIEGRYSERWDRNGQVGDTAVVEEVFMLHRDGTIGVRWENPRFESANRIDASCFEVIGARDIPIPPGTPGTSSNLPTGRLMGSGGIACNRCDWATPSREHNVAMRQWREHREECR